MRYHILIAFLALTFLWPVGGMARAGDPKTELPSDFDGRYVLLVLKNKAMFSLEKVKVRSIGNQSFLLASQLFTDSSKEGYPVMFPVTDVRSLHGFATFEDLKKNKALLFPDPPAAPASIQIDADKVDPYSADRIAMAAAAGLVIFIGGVVVGWLWNRRQGF